MIEWNFASMNTLSDSNELQRSEGFCEPPSQQRGSKPGSTETGAWHAGALFQGRAIPAGPQLQVKSRADMTYLGNQLRTGPYGPARQATVATHSIVEDDPVCCLCACSPQSPKGCDSRYPAHTFFAQSPRSSETSSKVNVLSISPQKEDPGVTPPGGEKGSTIPVDARLALRTCQLYDISRRQPCHPSDSDSPGPPVRFRFGPLGCAARGGTPPATTAMATMATALPVMTSITIPMVSKRTLEYVHKYSVGNRAILLSQLENRGACRSINIEANLVVRSLPST